MGIKEQIAFPEISIDKINNITGMDITFVTNTDSDEDAFLLLQEFGLPFKEDNTRREKVKAQLAKQAQEERRELEDAAKKQISVEEGSEEDISEVVSNEEESSVLDKQDNITKEIIEKDKNDNDASKEVDK